MFICLYMDKIQNFWVDLKKQKKNWIQKTHFLALKKAYNYYTILWYIGIDHSYNVNYNLFFLFIFSRKCCLLFSFKIDRISCFVLNNMHWKVDPIIPFLTLIKTFFHCFCTRFHKKKLQTNKKKWLIGFKMVCSIFIQQKSENKWTKKNLQF